MADSEQEKAKKQAAADAEQKQTDAETAAQASGRGAMVAQPGTVRAAVQDEGDDETVGIGDEIQEIADRLGEMMNDDKTAHPSISKAITRLGEAQQALHEYRAKRGLLPKDTFPPEKPQEGDPVR